MDRVLELLQAADGYLSGQAISEQLGVSRAAVWKHIKALQQTGYEIDSRTNRGYRLIQSPDLLTEQTVRQALGEHPWAGQIQVLAEVDSTNNRAKQLGSAGAPAGNSSSGGQAECRTGAAWEKLPFRWRNGGIPLGTAAAQPAAR